MTDVKSLIGEVKLDGFEDLVQVFLVNNSYFSVVYKEKEEYYTKNKNFAFGVGKIILTFFKNLSLGASFFNQNSSEEEKWKTLNRFIREESNKSEVDWQICLSVYQSLEATYRDVIDKVVEEKTLLSKRTAIRNKDNLMTTITKIASLFNEEEAKRNLSRYKRMRNEYINTNPNLNLNLL